MNVLDARTLHFVGIGGAGMSPLAELLVRDGKTVSGSDLIESDTTRHLRTLGVRITIGHDARNVGTPDAVIHTAAVKPDHPELAAARAAGIPMVRRADLLGALMRRKRGVAVSGAHGKTTTTAMIGAVLVRAGLDPTVIVGGSFRGGGSNLRPGRGDVLVAEADEYDRAFHALTPEIAVITNVDLEHLDTYRNMDDLVDAFARFAGSVPEKGLVVLGIESPAVEAIVPKLTRRLVTFGITPGAEVSARDVEVTGAGTRFLLVVEGRAIQQVTLRAPGSHNVRNALAALAVARAFGVETAVAATALGQFPGMARRFEIKGERDGVLVVDDYAHHPTEIVATISAARALYADRRLVVVFQPHLYSRTRDFSAEFGKALLGAPVALIAPIYPAREQPIPGITSALLTYAARQAGHRNVRDLGSDDEVAPALRDTLRAGDVLLTLGAGDVARFGAW